MDFNAKRLALLAGVGNPEDRHAIVQEQAQQLNESIEARQTSSDEEDVRKAVRRTIQKMVSEGAINLQEDSIARELEHLRANLQADHDHIAALVDDMHDDKDEIERAEHHREEMHEEEGYGITGGAMHVFEDEDTVSDADLEDDPAYDASEDDDDEYDLTDEEKAKRAADRAAAAKKVAAHPFAQAIKKGLETATGGGKPGDEVKESINENDAALMRLQKLAGLQILSEGHHGDHMEEDELEEDMVDGVDPAPPAFAQRVGELSEDEDGVIYELEGGGLEMQLGDKRYVLQELEGGEDLDEVLDEVEIDTFTDKDGNKWSKSE